MNLEFWTMSGLLGIMTAVLLLPFFSKRIEEELELFLLIMGLAAVSFSHLWSVHLVQEALWEPVKITAAVFVAGLLFRGLRNGLRRGVTALTRKVGYRPVVFLTVAGLGLASSIMTAIVAALALAEIISALQFPRKYEVKVVVIACFAIGMGAVLTPLGEPLSTIVIAKLQGPPYHADFFFLFKQLGPWVIPAVLGLAVCAAYLKIPGAVSQAGLQEDRPERWADIGFRALKVYVFVAALVLLGTGFTPLVERFLLHLSPSALYWINMLSAVLDNATLAAAEVTPKMSLDMLRYLLLGLLISGGMLIPGNIPNIICAGKLSIRSREWARVGVPWGLALMLIFFGLLRLL